MAEQLIARWKLAVLRVTLDVSGTSPGVVTSLHSFPDDVEVEHWKRTDPLVNFGLAPTGEVPETLGIPRALADAIVLTMSEVRSTEPDTSLWLRLEPPYGYLGAAPWETLGGILGIPVLRVPDHLPASARLGRVWRIAVLASAPVKAVWAADHVRAFATALAGREFDVELDVFPDANVHALLSAGPELPGEVRVHDPSRPADRPHRPSVPAGTVPGLRTIETLDDPRLVWSDWVIGGIGDAGVSAVHIAATGRPTADRSSVVVSSDPGRKGRKSATIEADDLWVLADSLGASLVSMAAPEASGPDIGARMVADRLGQLRPGPTVFSSIVSDPAAASLAQVHDFFGTAGERTLPPGGPEWFGYVQPDSALDVLDVPTTMADPDTDPDAEPLLRSYVSAAPPAPPSSSIPEWTERFAGNDSVPRWVSSSSRFLESQQAGLMSSISNDDMSGTVKRAYDRGAAAALDDIQSIVSEHLGKD